MTEAKNASGRGLDKLDLFGSLLVPTARPGRKL
jgi:hypothetical protein